MTYGWAILVVLAGIGALAYFGVLSPSSFVPDKCIFPSGIDCIEQPSIDGVNDIILIVLNNGLSRPISYAVDQTIDIINTNDCDEANAVIQEIIVKNQTGSFKTCVSGDVCTVEEGQPAVIKIHCPNLRPRGTLRAEIFLEYVSLQSGASHYVAGDISGKIG
ncbi:MAG: hypothetical protein ABIH34_07395, partial [Nanoarchaeota archaeon]